MTGQAARFRYAFILAFLLIGTPALAVTDDAMEAQRCIWRCMSDTPDWSGRGNREYNQCTMRKCGSQKANKKRRRNR